MKNLLNFLAIALLNGAFLYPLFFSGIGRPVAWWLVGVMAAGGTAAYTSWSSTANSSEMAGRIDKTRCMYYKSSFSEIMWNRKTIGNCGR